MATTAAVLDILVNAKTREAAAELRKVDRELNKTQRTAGDTDRSMGALSNRFRSTGGAVGGANRNFQFLRNTMMLIKFPAMIAGAGAAAQALSALGAGAVGLTAALGPLVGSLVALPAAFGAAGQGAATALLAFGGLGEALGAMSDEQSTAGSTAVDMAGQQRAAAESVRAAEQALASSQRQVKFAQEDLTQAREDAARQLVDMRLAAEGGALSEKRAILSLQEARRRVSEVRADPTSTTLDMRDALLSVQEAELGVASARAENKRAHEDLRDAEKDGIRGSEQIVSARRALADAQRSATDSARQLKSAQLDANTALASGGGAADQVAQKMAKLSPAARDFARFLFSLKPQLDKLKQTAGENLFPGLQKGMQSAAKNMPVINKIIGLTAKTMGRTAEQAGKLFGSEGFGRDLGKIGQSNAKLLGNMGSASLHLASALRHVMVAARPLVNWMGKLAVGWSKNIEGAAKAGRESGRLAHFFRQTRDVMERLGSIASNLAGAFGAIGKAAAPMGRSILAALDKASGGFEDWTKSVKGKRDLAEYFERAKPAIFEMGRLIGDVVKAFFRLGNTPGLKTLIHALRVDLLPVLEDVISTTTAALGPKLVRLGVELAKLFGNFAGATGALSRFVDMLTMIVSLFNKLPGPVKNAASEIVAFGLIFKALSFAGTVSGVRKLATAFGLLKVEAAGAAIATQGAGVAAGAGTAGAAAGVAGGVAGAGAKGAATKGIVSTAGGFMPAAGAAAGTSWGGAFTKKASSFLGKVRWARVGGVGVGLAVADAVVKSFSDRMGEKSPDLATAISAFKDTSPFEKLKEGISGNLDWDWTPSLTEGFLQIGQSDESKVAEGIDKFVGNFDSRFKQAVEGADMGGLKALRNRVSGAVAEMKKLGADPGAIAAMRQLGRAVQGAVTNLGDFKQGMSDLRSGLVVRMQDIQSLFAENTASINQRWKEGTKPWAEHASRNLRLTAQAIQRGMRQGIIPQTQANIARVKALFREARLVSGKDPLGFAAAIGRGWAETGKITNKGINRFIADLGKMPAPAREKAAKAVLGVASQLDRLGVISHSAFLRVRSAVVKGLDDTKLVASIRSARLVSSIARVFGTLGAAVGGGINSMIGAVKDALKQFKVKDSLKLVDVAGSAVGTVAGALFPGKGNQRGGIVAGTGDGDKVRAVLPPDSFVLNKKATAVAGFQKGGIPVMLEPGERVFYPGEVAKVGVNKLQALNAEVPRFAAGGTIDWKGQAKVPHFAAGGTIVWDRQLPRFAQGGVMEPQVRGIPGPIQDLGQKALHRVHGAAKKYQDSRKPTDDLGSGSASWKKIDKFAGSFGLGINNSYRPGDAGSWHGVLLNDKSGRAHATDYTPAGSGAYKFANRLGKRMGSKLKELIYSPLGWSIDNGQKVAPYAVADHYDHVHVALQKGGVVGLQKGGKLDDLVGGSSNWDLTERSTLANLVGAKSPGLMGAISMVEAPNHLGGSKAHGPPDGRGLWQIEWPIHSGSLGHLGDPYNPYANAKMMKSIQDSQGLGAWVVYNEGTYGARGKSDPGLATRMRTSISGKAVDTATGSGAAAGSKAPPAPKLSRKQKRRLKRLTKDMKRLAGFDLKVEGEPLKLQARITRLTDEVDLYAEYADRASALTDSEEGSLPAAVKGLTEEGWLQKQLDALFSLRNTLIRAMQKLKAAKDRIATKIKRLEQKDLTPKERDHIQDRLRRERDKPKKRRDQQLIAALQHRLNADDRSGALFNARAITGLTGISTTIDTKSGELGESLTTVHGLGSSMKIFDSRPPIGELGGSIFDVQDRIQDLQGRLSGSITDDSETKELTNQLLRQIVQRGLVGDAQKVFPNFAQLMQEAGVPFGGSFQRGGMIAGQGVGDKVPVLAEAGEGFINRKAVQALGGASAVNQINQLIPRFGEGGVVLGFANGGTVQAAGVPQTVSAPVPGVGEPVSIDSNIRVEVHDHRIRVFRDEKEIEAVVKKVTRGQARGVGRTPGSAGSLRG